MRLFSVPSAVLGLLAIAYLPATAFAKPYPLHDEDLQQLHKNPLLQRQVLSAVDCPAPGKHCGYYNQACCSSSEICDVSTGIALCKAGSAGGGGGAWQVYTSTWVESVGLVTHTSVYSNFVPGPAATPATCGTPLCGNTCCPGGYWCANSAQSQCQLIAGGSSGGAPLPTVAPPVTYTGRPTMTVPFQSPIPTGAAGGNPEQVAAGGGGLSGGAIAGIVIGVLLGIFLLLLLCLFCCARALFDTFAAIFGFGKKKKHTHEETTYIEGHHSGGGAAAGRWYGSRPGRPSRVGSEKKHGGIGKAGGVAAALGGLALVLGLKRKHDKKHDDKSTTVSGSSYYYSDYTSSSSASSDDRRTRTTRNSRR